MAERVGEPRNPDGGVVDPATEHRYVADEYLATQDERSPAQAAGVVGSAGKWLSRAAARDVSRVVGGVVDAPVHHVTRAHVWVLIHGQRIGETGSMDAFFARTFQDRAPRAAQAETLGAPKEIAEIIVPSLGP